MEYAIDTSSMDRIRHTKLIHVPIIDREVFQFRIKW